MKLDKLAISYKRGLDRDKDGNAWRHRPAARGLVRGIALPREGDTLRLTTLGHKGRRSRLAHCGAATGMNTTKLISHWSMSGARRDVGGRFRATDDIVAVIAGNQPTPEPTAAGSSFLIKASDEEGWQPLGETTGGRV